jgi:hypothetical protein
MHTLQVGRGLGSLCMQLLSLTMHGALTFVAYVEEGRREERGEKRRNLLSLPFTVVVCGVLCAVYYVVQCVVCGVRFAVCAAVACMHILIQM